MAKKIVKGVVGIFGGGKKKVAPVEEPKGPIITALNPGPEKARKGFRSNVDALRQQRTILEDRLGGTGTLGG